MSGHLISRQSPRSAPMSGVSGVSIEVHLGHDEPSATQNQAGYPLSSDVWAETVLQSPVLGDGAPTGGSSQPNTPPGVGVDIYGWPHRHGGKAARMAGAHEVTCFVWRDLVNRQVFLGA